MKDKDTHINLSVSDSLDTSAAVNVLAGTSPVIVNASISDSLRSSVNVTNELHYHDRHICYICNKNIKENEHYFSCAHCKREPIHEECGDMGLTLCRSCIEAWERKEKLRERCAPLVLSAETGNEILSFLLLAKSAPLLGRARGNDIVTRIFSAAGKLSEEATGLISRKHCILRVSKFNGRESLKMYDCGSNGEGSAYGTWIGNRVFPRTTWEDIPDDCELCIGKHQLYGGLTFRVSVYRSPYDANQIDCVRLKRQDALRAHHYILVYRSAVLGLGKCALSLGENQPTVPWGKVMYDEDSSSFTYESFPQSPLVTNTVSPCRLTPEMLITGGNVKISTRLFSENMFTEFN